MMIQEAAISSATYIPRSILISSRRSPVQVVLTLSRSTVAVDRSGEEKEKEKKKTGATVAGTTWLSIEVVNSGLACVLDRPRFIHLMVPLRKSDIKDLRGIG